MKQKIYDKSIGLGKLEKVMHIKISLFLFISGCMVYQSVYLPTFDFNSSPSDPIHNITHDSCILISDLGRFVLSEFDFNVTFAMPDRGEYPKPLPLNSLFVPDYAAIVTQFWIDNIEDIGGTLKVGLASANPSVLVRIFL